MNSLSTQEIHSLSMHSSSLNVWIAEDNEEMMKKSFLLFERNLLAILKKDKGSWKEIRDMMKNIQIIVLIILLLYVEKTLSNNTIYLCSKGASCSWKK